MYILIWHTIIHTYYYIHIYYSHIIESYFSVRVCYFAIPNHALPVGVRLAPLGGGGGPLKGGNGGGFPGAMPCLS